ncbi:MAG: amidohydrolase [Armatimonadetes bacterium]|nr:amidohydrolase [Armatimonadota bacterium]MBX3108995.1 amidohydrolase [Fimbriimonadaceae bacterium]
MLRKRIDSDAAYLAALRHDFHRCPELMYEEVQTSGRVQTELTKAGVAFKNGLAKGTGVLGFIPATRPGGKCVALRADMDALPILEETGLPYASETPGKMHACGHDGHTTILVGVARALSQEENRPNDVLLLFQPAEEGGAGGRAMCEDGALDGRVLGKPADIIYGLHGWPDEAAGQIRWKVGPMMAATNSWTITVRGQGGHAAAPHTTADPVIAAAHIVTALQSIASRNVDPLDSVVVSTTKLDGGSAHNVIPESVEIWGTLRTLKEETRHMASQRILEIAQGVAAAMGCSAQVDIPEGYPVTVNDASATANVRRVAEQVLGEGRVAELANPVMGGEDFSYYGAHVPASFFFVGLNASSGKMASVHTPRFDFNDSVIPDCVELMCRLALDTEK